MGAQGSFVAINNVVSQSVPHLHTHVVPRVRKDGLRGFFWPRTKYEHDDHAAETAERSAARSLKPAALSNLTRPSAIARSTSRSLALRREPPVFTSTNTTSRSSPRPSPSKTT